MGARIGIDLGTTNTVVAWADRGNFPVLSLTDSGLPTMPTVVAWKGDALRIGEEAREVWNGSDWQVLPSPKRWFGVPEPAPLGGTPASGAELERLMVGFFRQLHERILATPHLEGETELEAMLGVPANSNSLQRLRTVRAAEAAGFKILGLLHEPTASAIEYAHLHRGFARSKERRHVVVYDLGGGTFDAAIVASGPSGFEVVRSGGIERLGGDDFDQAMAELAIEKAGLRWSDIPWPVRHRLLQVCRDTKESLKSTTKKWLVDLSELGAGEIPVYTEEYYDRCRPLIEQTIVTLEDVLSASSLNFDSIDALLLVGGGSQMPLVRRRLKEIFGSRLKLSPHPFASTAVGLAIQADRVLSSRVDERFSRYFGVWREAEGGARPQFDAIFDRQTLLPQPGEKLVIRRAYRPVHDIGRFRFEECSSLGPDGNPSGIRTPWCEIYFPFDPAIPHNEPLHSREVTRSERFAAYVVEEQYECDSQGMITVRLVRHDPYLSLAYLLYGPERVAPLTASPRDVTAGPLTSEPPETDTQLGSRMIH